MSHLRLAALALVLPAFPAMAGLAPFEGVAQVGIGLYHLCALTTAGKVKCWGGGRTWEQLGISEEPFQRETNLPDVPGLPAGIQRIAAGDARTCAIDRTGAVTCWGRYDSGQNASAEVVSGIPEGATAAAYGLHHGCALTTTGSVRCWGSGPSGELGVPAGAPGDGRVAGLPEPAVAVAVGEDHSCAVLAGGGVACWGLIDMGEVGDGTRTRRDTATLVTGLAARAVSVAAGRAFTCALLEGGAVQCWGTNGEGQLGDGTYSSSATPRTVAGLAGVTKIAAGHNQACALKGDGTVWCWGRRRGTPYDSRAEFSFVPVRIPDEVAVDVAVGGMGVCLVTPQARLRCRDAGTGIALVVGRSAWGYNVVNPATVLERTVIIAGDATRDRRAEIIWRDTAGAGVAWWTMDGAAPAASAYFPAGPEWTLAGTGDFNGDGSTDLVWRRQGDGATYMWLLDGLSILGYRDFGTRAPPEWVLAGTPDLDGDGISDFLWRTPDGWRQQWLSVGNHENQSFFGSWPPSTRVLGFADTNRDGFAETVLWAPDGTLSLAFRLLAPLMGPDPLSVVAIGRLDPALWRLAAFADFDGDGRADLLWRAVSGEIYIWFMQSATVTGAAPVWNPGLDWSIRAVADVDGDGKADILWRRHDGTTYLWTMDGAAVKSALPIVNPGGSWQAIAP
jgi:alpha-tubulin suppressor-like RCC1 family protein